MTEPIQIPQKTHDGPIVLFDGLCNYCHWMVQLAIRWDPEMKLKFASLDSATARQLQSDFQWKEDLNSMIFIENRQVYYYSTAVLKALSHLRGPLSFLRVLRFVPTRLRDPMYKWVAANRYRWFGKKDHCPIPGAAQLSRFLP